MCSKFHLDDLNTAGEDATFDHYEVHRCM